MEWQRFLKEAFLFFFKDVTKKGALIFLSYYKKKGCFLLRFVFLFSEGKYREMECGW
jgi:hypothetical protein